ncbi:hypothetical protein PMNALOAF_0397 [Methylobacterium adhaesivum]|jgi:hypothetical protein|uniref:Uncharacterized protein n=1 Tax=Methylobacterium adhaesivum TaxID=333297 RepID=A0ABT8BDF0_9HYPH|nr:hypothetical protein [Methylobacterium adhaesivum]MDN3590097.1 hypothetical protein [Methylobacterium adhaesivum]GJD29165.1 hypothetical protein PMNALOAF_0397 [Methylobacterium adhaesivum]
MFKVMILGLLCSATLTVFGIALAAGVIGHPIDGQLPADWGWSFIMMGAASLFAFGFFEWRHLTHRS